MILSLQNVCTNETAVKKKGFVSSMNLFSTFYDHRFMIHNIMV